MTQTFEEFLMGFHASNNPHTDDMLPELFADWMTEEVDIERLIELAELWHKQEMAKETKRTIDLLDEVIKVLKELK